MVVPLLLLMTQAAPPTDSMAVLEAARDLQADFERRRRWMLPVSAQRGWSCDVTVGRYCYWYDEREPPPPAEPEAIRLARRALLDSLGVLAGQLPGDGWIAGQRVRYLGDQGRHEAAATVARQCLADRWWCAMLEGYAMHRAGLFSEAEQAFGRGIAGMPVETRCEWNDLEPLLESGWLGRYRRADCREREVLNDWIFQLARPGFGQEANAFLTEFWARRTFLRILDGAVTHHGGRMSSDLGEIVLRYGWATAFSRPAPIAGRTDPPSVIGHEPRPAYPFLPDLEDDSVVAWNWGARTPRARYHLPGVPRLVPMVDPLVARFRRGHRTVVVAGFSAPTDTLFRHGGTALLGLATSRGVQSLATGDAPRGQGTLGAVAGAADRLVLGIEVADPATGAVALHREVIRPLDRAPSGFSVSDLLLYDPDSTSGLPDDLDAALGAMLPGARLPATHPVGLYWEVYGLTPEDGLDVSVEVEEVGVGFFARLGRAVGLGRQPAPVRIAWRMEGEGDARNEVGSQAIVVDLRSLSPGRYRIVVTLEHPGFGRRQILRPIRIMPPEA